jgi:hypothetical protein
MPKHESTDRAIEERYQSGTLRLSQERNDFLLPQVLDFVEKAKWINLHPEYQRRLVWDKKKRSLFIESLLMNVPIPPVFLFESEYGRYEVMDGQQRLNTIVEFYGNRFKLTGMDKWPELNGKSYADCPPVIQRGLDRRRISAVVVLAENLRSDQDAFDVRRTVFERLNTGGQNLLAQELRNCLYSGPFNELLIELAGEDLFDDIWDIPRYSENIRGGHIAPSLAENTYFKRMRDCEIVLRFFAFREKSNVKGAVKTILDRCMNDNMSISKQRVDDLRQVFLTRLKVCHEIFEDRTFRVGNKEGRYELSQPLYDAEMIAVDRLYQNSNSLIRDRTQICERLEKELTKKSLYELITAKANTASAIKGRLDAIESIMRVPLG